MTRWKGNLQICFELPSKNFLYAAFRNRRICHFKEIVNFLRRMAFLTHIHCVLHLTFESLPVVFSLNLPFSFLEKQFPFSGFSFRVWTQCNRTQTLGAARDLKAKLNLKPAFYGWVKSWLSMKWHDLSSLREGGIQVS